MIVLSFQLTQEDLYQFNNYTSWTAPENRKKRLKYYLRNSLSGVVLIIFFLLFTEKINMPKLLLLAGLFFLILFISIPYWIKRHYRKYVKAFCTNPENSSFFEPLELTINETGILMKDNSSTSTYLWSAFIRKVETENYLYLYLNSILGVIIPKKSFESQKQKEDFDNLLLMYFPLQADLNSINNKEI